MTATSASESQLLVPESTHSEDAATFVRWALDQLPLQTPPLQTSDAGTQWLIELDPEDRPAFNGRQQVRIDFDAKDSSHDAESIDWSGRLVSWLQDKLKGPRGAIHVRPREQPMAVNDISRRLFAAYEVDSGNTHLAGCQLSDHPFLRLSFLEPVQPSATLRHIFVAPDGSSVDDQLVAALGLNNVVGIAHAPPRIEDAPLRALVAAGRRIAEKRSSQRDPSAKTVEPLMIAIVWVRYAEGSLRFTIGDATAELPFSGWAKLLQPKPLVGRDSGVASFHLAVTDDGRIEAAEAIASCQQSGRRVLFQELVQCSVTERRVLPKFTDECPVTGLPAMKEQFAACSNCLQSVSKTAMGEAQVCRACRQLQPIRRDDARLVWILGEHTGLERWKRWKLSETASVYIAQADGMAKSVLVVVDKETLAVQRLATRGRFSSDWVDSPDSRQDELLR